MRRHLPNKRLTTVHALFRMAADGATVAMLNNTGKAYYSPYWCRLNDTLPMKNLADSTYQTDAQEWLRLPI
jgi:hypothetical protein